MIVTPRPISAYVAPNATPLMVCCNIGFGVYFEQVVVGFQTIGLPFWIC